MGLSKDDSIEASWDRLLLEAVENDEVDRVRECLKAGANVNAPNLVGNPAIFSARTDAVVGALVEAGADIHARARSGAATPLHFATWGNRSRVEAFLHHGSDPNARDDKGETPLSYALDEGAFDIMELLIAHGADIDARDKDGRTLLHWAVLSKQPEGAKVLVDHCADTEIKDNEGHTPLVVASYYGCGHAISRLLIDAGANVNPGGDHWPPLHHAASWSDNDLIKILIEAGANVNTRCDVGGTALGVALWAGHDSTARLLRELGGVE